VNDKQLHDELSELRAQIERLETHSSRKGRLGRSISRRASVLLITMVIAVVMAVAPSVTGGVNAAQTVQYAKIDGSNVVPGTNWNISATSANGLQGRAVATATPTAGQVLKYDGNQWAPAADYGPGFGDSAFKPGINIIPCGSMDELVTLPITVTRPTRIYADAFASIGNGTDTNFQRAIVTAELYDSVGTKVASDQYSRTVLTTNGSFSYIGVSGVMRAANSAAAFEAQPGTYVLKFLGDGEGGSCGGTMHASDLGLTYMLVGTQN
jgi:hypothetical protein